MKTRYIYTAKAEDLARANNLQEYRKAGTAASFAYQPLELSPITAEAWTKAGYIEEAPEPVDFLTFTLTYTANSAMVKLFQENHIDYFYNLGQIYADIDRTGKPVKVDYYHIATDPATGLNLFGVMKAPRRTGSYFDMTSEDLYKSNADGWTKEETLLCDNCPDAHPFADDYISARNKAEYYKSIGCEGVEILQRINNKYAVIAY